MSYIDEIRNYIPVNMQETQDKKLILSYIELFPQNILLRENEFAHISSSGFILNEAFDKALMIHHNIRNTWAWTGGHMDGDTDLLYVALKEAKEETGIKTIVPFSNSIAAIDILPVFGHVKNGNYVSAHMHLSIGYILIADENEKTIVKEDETSGIKWITLDQINENNFDAGDYYLYNKLIKKTFQ